MKKAPLYLSHSYFRCILASTYSARGFNEFPSMTVLHSPPSQDIPSQLNARSMISTRTPNPTYSKIYSTTRENRHTSSSSSIANNTTRSTHIATTHSCDTRSLSHLLQIPGRGASVIAMVMSRGWDVNRIRYERSWVLILGRGLVGREIGKRG